VIYASGVFATNGAVDTVPVADTRTEKGKLDSILNWIAYYGVAFWSTLLALIAAVAFSTAHFWSE